MNQPDNIWRIRNVDDATRKRIRLYALQHDMSVGEALKALIDLIDNQGMNLPVGNHTINGTTVIVPPYTGIIGKES